MIWRLWARYRLRIYLGAALAALLVATHGAVYVKGRADADVKHAKKTEQGVRTHAAVEAEIMRLSDADLNERLDRWMRD